MTKKFLLIAGENYYPSQGTGDWVGTYETEKEILDTLQIFYDETFFLQGPRKGQLKEKRVCGCEIFGRKYDWYEIVNLEDKIF